MLYSVYSPSRPTSNHPKPEDSPIRGFQPYRHGHSSGGGGGSSGGSAAEEIRSTIPPAAHHPPPLTPYDQSVMAAAVSASYPFHPFMNPAHMQYAAFR